MGDGALWIVGGLDPSGGGGVLRDVATVRAMAPHRPVHVVITALTQQGDGKKAVAGPMDACALEFQFKRAPKPAAIKIGLVPAAVASVVAKAVAEVQAPKVVDPVLSASIGGPMAADPEALLELMEGALVTPNRKEYDALIGGADPQGWLEIHGAVGLLRKGGHDGDDQVSDTLWSRKASRVFSRPRVVGPDPRGTGCALASAIACELADGLEMSAAVGKGIAWLDGVRGQAHSVGGQVLLR